MAEISLQKFLVSPFAPLIRVKIKFQGKIGQDKLQRARITAREAAGPDEIAFRLQPVLTQLEPEPGTEGGPAAPIVRDTDV